MKQENLMEDKRNLFEARKFNGEDAELLNKEKMFKPIIQEKQNKENQTLSASIVAVYITKRKKSL